MARTLPILALFGLFACTEPAGPVVSADFVGTGGLPVASSMTVPPVVAVAPAPVAATAAAPLGETVDSAGADSGLSRLEVEPIATAPRVAGFDARALLASLSEMRRGLPGEHLQAFDEATMSLISVAARRARSTDEDSGPAANLVHALDAIQGLDAATIVKRAEAVSLAVAGPRGNANEAAAIATLKSIASAQAQFRATGAVDTDGDDQGEFGRFSELAGVAPLRGRSDDKKMSPPVLSAAFGRLEDGVVLRSGYAFRIWLPTAARGHYVSERDEAALTVPVDADLSEVTWRCYAWPVERGVSGERAFFVDQTGDVLACANEQAQWSGADFGPDFSSAIQVGSLFEPAADAVGQSGDRWVAVN